MWVMMHAEQSYLNRDFSVLEQKGRHAIVSYKLIYYFFGSIIMFDSGMFLLSFDTDYIGWKHRAWCRVQACIGLNAEIRIWNACQYKKWLSNTGLTTGLLVGDNMLISQPYNLSF